MRHGETPWNTELRLQGQTDIALNEKGRALARESARAMQDIPFDLVITSPLGRAKETAEIVTAGRSLPVIVDARIAEIGFGTMEGRQISPEEREDPDSEFYTFFNDPLRYTPPEGGETFTALCARTADFLEELKNRQEWYDKTILVSTHGAASRALLAAIKKTEQGGFWEKGVPKNCAVTIVDLEHGEWMIKEQDKVYYEDI
jgi:probable phosphoglycerate mutase